MANPVPTADIDVAVSQTGIKRTFLFVTKTASGEFTLSWNNDRPLRITAISAGLANNPFAAGAGVGCALAVTFPDNLVTGIVYQFKSTVALSWTRDGRDNQAIDVMIPTGGTISLLMVNHSDDPAFVTLIVQAEEYEDPGLFGQITGTPCGFVSWVLGRCKNE